MDHKELIDTLRDAGISLTEASKLLPVSRATLHNWKSGTTHGDALRISIVSGYTRLIKRAVAANRLPLPSDTPRGERLPLIKRILADIRQAS